MSDDALEPVLPDDTPGYGDPAILVCGWPSQVRDELVRHVQASGFADVPLLFAGNEDLELPLGALFRKDPAVLPQESRMPLAIVFSGLSPRRFSQFIDQYKTMPGLPRPIWGGLMPQTTSWTLRRLLQTYQAEAKAFARQGRA